MMLTADTHRTDTLTYSEYERATYVVDVKNHTTFCWVVQLCVELLSQMTMKSWTSPPRQELREITGGKSRRKQSNLKI